MVFYLVLNKIFYNKIHSKDLIKYFIYNLEKNPNYLMPDINIVMISSTFFKIMSNTY